MNFKGIKEKMFVFLVQYNKLVSLVVFAAIIGSGYVFLVKPLYDDMKTKIETSKTYNNALYGSKMENVGSLLSIINDYKQITDADKERINKILPSDSDHINLFPQLEYIVLKNGMIPKSISIVPINDFGAEQSLSRVGGFAVSITVSGAVYNNFKKLLKDFEQNLRIMDVNKVSYSVSNKTASLELTAYYWKE